LSGFFVVVVDVRRLLVDEAVLLLLVVVGVVLVLVMEAVELTVVGCGVVLVELVLIVLVLDVETGVVVLALASQSHSSSSRLFGPFLFRSRLCSWLPLRFSQPFFGRPDLPWHSSFSR
jgi:hypothetical protein